MTTIRNFAPPPYYVKQTRTAAWLRLGKIAVISILAGLSAAVGLALPDGNDAEAQGVSVRAGYSYTRMICQEWGQQPRWYNVRDPIAGSDWRNDGGWAIVLTTGGIFYAADAGGAYVKSNSAAVYRRFLPGGDGNPQRYDLDSGPPPEYNPESNGGYVRIGPGWADAAFLRVTSWAQPVPRYSQQGAGGGVRWADMRYCR